MRYKLVVKSNPAPGQEAEYNRWYDEQHIPDVLDVPGFVSAQRFAYAETQMAPNAEPSHRYLAIYDIDTDDLPATLAAFRARGGTPQMVMSDAIDRKSSTMEIFAEARPMAYPSRRKSAG